MNFRIGWVFELLWDDRIRIAFCDFLCLGDSALHAFRAFGQHEFGTEQLEKLATFNRHGFRHSQHQTVALGGGCKCQRNTGVAGGWFHKHGLARNSFALSFKRFNQCKTDTILDACQWVEEF
ncbi:hypothetical protein FQZ97_815520 [compost metagenome]